MSKANVLMIKPMLPSVTAALEETTTLHKLWEQPHADAWIAEHGSSIQALTGQSGIGRIDSAWLNRLPNLQLIANFGVGYDNIDVVEAAKRGVVVTNTPDVLTDEVADLTIGLLIATLRQIPQADAYLRDGKWAAAPFPLSNSLRGRRVGIVGMGRIGAAVAQRLAAFDIPIAYWGRRQRTDLDYAFYDDLKKLATECDVLTLHVPGGEATKGIIDADILQALGPNGVLINTARGNVVNEDDLVAALRDGVILSAGLDVFSNEPNVASALIALPQVVLLPHIGSGSVVTREAMGKLMVDNITHWFATGAPLTPVPETPVPTTNTP